MSLMRKTYWLLFLTMAVAGNGTAQLFTDQGLYSGSGLTVLPTATIAPPSEFRVQYSRVNFLSHGRNGLNVIGLSSGLSSSLEWYMRLTSEQVGTTLSQVAYGFGGKFRYPGILPVVRRLALWVDKTTSDQPQYSSIYPLDAMRLGVTTTVDSNGIHPTMMLGIAKFDDRVRPLVGGGVTIAAGNHAQIGLEIVHCYLGVNSSQAAASASFRLMSNISVLVSPGYLSTSSASTWTFSLGISFSTSDIDFHPAYEEKHEEEYLIPSIEELEKGEQKETPKSSLEGSLPQGAGEQNLANAGTQATTTGHDGSIAKKTTTKKSANKKHASVKPARKSAKQEEKTHE
jgi:hypothetical protein